MVNIIVTGAGALLGQGVIRSIQASSLEARIVAVDPSPLSTGLYWADTAYIVPMASAPDYLEALEDVIRKESPDVVLVGTDVELAVLAEHRNRLEAVYGTHVLVSSPRVVEIADDKWQTVEFLRDNGFPYPDSCLPEDEASLAALVERVGFPLIVKPRRGARSVGLSRVEDWDELQRAVHEGTGLIVQECVGSEETEYTAGVLCFDGEARASIVMRRHLRDGNTYRAFVEPFSELNAWVRTLAESLDPYGPANFQFMYDGGEPKLFEINGRFSGTTPLRARAGFNEVEMAIRHILEGVSVEQPDVEPTTLLRFWSEVAVKATDIVPGSDSLGV